MPNPENQNALKHGAFSDVVILPGEDPKKFEELIESLNDEWNPEGPTEKDLVTSIALGMWRKRRFRRYLNLGIARGADKIDGLDSQIKRDFEALVEVLEQIESDVPDSVTEESLEKKLGEARADAIKRTFPRKRYDSYDVWTGHLSRCITAMLDAHIIACRDTVSVDEYMSDEELADREQSFEERIDAKIARDTKTLGQIQAMKSIGVGKRRAASTAEPLKEIASPPTQAAGTE